MRDLQPFWTRVAGGLAFLRLGILLLCALFTICLISIAQAHTHLPVRGGQQPSPLSPLASQPYTVDTLPTIMSTPTLTKLTIASNQTSLVLVVLVVGGVLLTLGLARWRQQ